MTSEEAKKRYYNAKKGGFCTKCGKKLPKDAGIYCDFCRAKAHIYYERRKERMQAAHKCIDCGADVVDGKMRCGECLRKANARYKKWYREKKARDENVLF